MPSVHAHRQQPAKPSSDLISISFRSLRGGLRAAAMTSAAAGGSAAGAALSHVVIDQRTSNGSSSGGTGTKSGGKGTGASIGDSEPLADGFVGMVDASEDRARLVRLELLPSKARFQIASTVRTVPAAASLAAVAAASPTAPTKAIGSGRVSVSVPLRGLPTSSAPPLALTSVLLPLSEVTVTSLAVLLASLLPLLVVFTLAAGRHEDAARPEWRGAEWRIDKAPHSSHGDAGKKSRGI